MIRVREGFATGPALNYHLEIYMPESTNDVSVVFDSDIPFPPLAVGDIINPFAWPDHGGIVGLFRVVRVEHLFWAASWHDGVEAKHKVMVFTEEVEDDRELRLTVPWQL